MSLNGVNNDTFDLAVANTFSGGFVCSSNANQGFRVNANADDALGTGDVTIGNDATLEISAGLTSTIDDTASLFLNGRMDSRRAAKLVLNSSETVNELWIDGTQQAAGPYDSSSTLTVGGSPLISGSGTLTVLSGGGTAPYDTWADGPFPSGNPLTDPTATLDFDFGGLATGIEWVVGGDPTDPSDDAGLVPTSTTDGTYLVFTYRRGEDPDGPRRPRQRALRPPQRDDHPVTRD